jgi:uncharacterized protein
MLDKPIVLLFIKTPVKGRVKSRLAADVGEESALELYKRFILDIIETLEKSAYPFRIYFDLPGSEATLEAWLGKKYVFLSQEGSDLGARMGNAFRKAFSEGFSNAMLIGSDIPDLSFAVIQEAFTSLRESDVVIGPAADGGYYLIGFNKNAFLPSVFQGVTWSTHTVFQETMNRARGERLRVHLAPEWRDVDTAADLQDLYERNRNTAFGKSRTMTYLAAHRENLFTRIETT